MVPTPDLPAENQADLTEDLTIMCRIFDKSVPAAGVSAGFAYGDRGDVLRWAIGQQSPGDAGPVSRRIRRAVLRPRGLSARADGAAGTGAGQGERLGGHRLVGDGPGDGRTAGRSSSSRARSAPAYDAQKVENLKKAAINTLAHASNIRMRRPQDVITLVLGALDDSRGSSYRRYGSLSRSTSAGVASRPPKPQPMVRNPAAALLVMRVTKADVDAFAKGQLTAAQFAEKVQTISTPVNAGAPAAPQPAPASAKSTR